MKGEDGTTCALERSAARLVLDRLWRLKSVGALQTLSAPEQQLVRRNLKELLPADSGRARQGWEVLRSRGMHGMQPIALTSDSALLLRFRLCNQGSWHCGRLVAVHVALVGLGHGAGIV